MVYITILKIFSKTFSEKLIERIVCLTYSVKSNMSSIINHCLSDLNCNWNDDLKNQNIDNWNKWIQAH